MRIKFAPDCFAEPVIGPANPDPLARNDGKPIELL